MDTLVVPDYRWDQGTERVLADERVETQARHRIFLGAAAARGQQSLLTGHLAAQPLPAPNAQKNANSRNNVKTGGVNINEGWRTSESLRAGGRHCKRALGALFWVKLV